jgi:hypothetical protein
MVATLVAPDDPDRLPAWCWTLRQISASLRDVLTEAELTLCEMAEPGVHESPGAPAWQARKGSPRRKWDTEALVPAVVRRALDPDGTGEIPPTMEAVDRLVSVLLATAPFTPSMGWRTSALRDLGIDPDEWSETSPGRPSIQWHGSTR